MLSHGSRTRRRQSSSGGSRTLHRASAISIHIDGLFTLGLFFFYYVHLQKCLHSIYVTWERWHNLYTAACGAGGHRAHPHAASRGGVRRAGPNRRDATRPRVVPRGAACPPATAQPTRQREAQQQMSRRPLSSQPVVSVAPLSLSLASVDALNALLLLVSLLSRSTASSRPSAPRAVSPRPSRRRRGRRSLRCRPW